MFISYYSQCIKHLTNFNVANDLPKKTQRQKWVVQTMESPKHDNIQPFFDHRSILSCTYHRNSDLPCHYGLYVSLKEFKKGTFQLGNIEYMKYVQIGKFETYNLLRKKNKSVLWMYSNCGIKFRNTYAKALQSDGIKLDIYGACGKKDPCFHQKKCVENLFHQYKFYLAFENSKCSDYITEKTWKSLSYGMVPIIYGAPMESCQYHLPPNSFLHVDNFSTPKKLAEYIDLLERNNKMYLRFHEWRKTYIALLTTNQISCSLCKSIFETKKSKQIKKSAWWTFKTHCKN